MNRKIFIIVIILVCVLSITIFEIVKRNQPNDLLEQLGYGQDNIVLIVNADDFGMHEAMNEAILELFNEDKIMSTSIMVACPNYDDAVNKALKHSLRVGLHMTLTNEWQATYPWSATLSKEQVPSLYNGVDCLYESGQNLFDNATSNDVYLEMKNQIEMAYESGLDLTHIDSHMYTYMGHEDYLADVLELAFEYRLPLLVSTKSREILEKSSDFREFLDTVQLLVPDTYMSFYYDKAYDQIENDYLAYLKNLEPGVHVLAIHPMYQTEDSMEKIEDYNLRYNDYMVWMSDDVQQILEEKNIILSSFEEIRDAQRDLWTDEFVEGVLGED